MKLQTDRADRIDPIERVTKPHCVATHVERIVASSPSSAISNRARQVLQADVKIPGRLTSYAIAACHRRFEIGYSALAFFCIALRYRSTNHVVTDERMIGESHDFHVIDQYMNQGNPNCVNILHNKMACGAT